MKLRAIILIGLLSIFMLRPALADVLVLVHGYASNAETWELSGVNSALQSRGWQRGGIYALTPAGMQHIPGPAISAGKITYSVNLPAEAPLLLQRDLLGDALYRIRQRHPDEKIVLAGHSAGGVVARLGLLGGNPYNVSALITIAAPHLGTTRAVQALDIVESKPFFCPGPGIDMLKSAFGGNGYNYLKYSRGVLIDLMPATPGSLVFWMNQQPHPDIKYHAVIRQTPFVMGDELVPAWSQDMNNVPVLRGHAKVYTTTAGHSLNPGDGALLAEILATPG